MSFKELYPGAKVSPASLIQLLGSSGTTSPDKTIQSEIVVNNGVDSCGFRKPNEVYCPSGWSPTPVRTFDPTRKEGYYCFKNAGLSNGNIDLCPAEGGQRIWFPANGIDKDLFKLLRGKPFFLKCNPTSSTTLFIYLKLRYLDVPITNFFHRHGNGDGEKETFGYLSI